MRALLRRLLAGTLAIVASAVLYACTSLSASPARPDEFRVVAGVGDTLTITGAWHTVGAVDSVVWSVTSPRTSDIFTVHPAGPQSAAVQAVPAPPLAVGEALTFESCLLAVVKGNVLPPVCQQVTYTRPGVVFDSVTVAFLYLLPGDTTLTVNASLQFCAFNELSDGSLLRTQESLGIECDEAWHYFVSVKQV